MTTLLDLTKRIANRYGGLRFHDGTATGGSTSTIVDPSLLPPDDFLKGSFAYVYSADDASPEGETRRITDYAVDTGTLTCAPVFTAAVAAGDGYFVSEMPRSKILYAIQSAIRKAGEKWLVESVDDTTLVIVADTYEYDLPTDLVQPLDVFYRTDDEAPYRHLRGGDWGVQGEIGSQTITLYDISDYDAGDILRLVYLRRPTMLEDDDDELDVGAPNLDELEGFIESWALYYMHDQGANDARQAAVFRAHLTKRDEHLKEAMYALERAPRRHRVGRIHTSPRPRMRG